MHAYIYVRVCAYDIHAIDLALYTSPNPLYLPPQIHPQPNLGERVPAGVKAEIVVDLAQFPAHLRAEWDGLREHDVLFLLTLEGPEVGVWLVFLCVCIVCRRLRGTHPPNTATRQTTGHQRQQGPGQGWQARERGGGGERVLRALRRAAREGVRGL